MDFVSILNPAQQQQEASAAGGNSAQAALTIGPYENSSLVLVTAHGSTSYNGPIMNAGMRLSINIDGTVVAADDSFEGESSSIPFTSAASHNLVLKKNATVRVEARVDHMGAGGISNSNTNVKLQCFALAVR